MGKDSQVKKKGFKWEEILLGKKEASRRKQIRKRTSYKRWKELWDLCDGVTNKETLLVGIHDHIDSMRGYGTRSKAFWSIESLDLLIEDMKNEEGV